MSFSFTGSRSVRVDSMVAEAVAAIGAAIAALRVPHLEGVVLGGGYGRGEGGVTTGPDGAERPYNDLDFYVVADDSSSAGDLAAIGAALAPLGREWGARIGVDVDFSPARTYWRMKHDERRLMVQELVRGYRDVAGKPGEELFAHIVRHPAEALPVGEAVRLLMNRGAGWLLASARGADASSAGDDANSAGDDAPAPRCSCGAGGAAAAPRYGGGASAFVARNLNKCVLGAGDARLIARGRYDWSLAGREGNLADPLYSAAAEWKRRPSGTPPCTAETARGAWLETECEVRAALRGSTDGRRAVRHAARWLVRRHTIGPAATFGLDPSARVMLEIGRAIRAGSPFTASMQEDWRIFN